MKNRLVEKETNGKPSIEEAKAILAAEQERRRNEFVQRLQSLCAEYQMDIVPQLTLVPRGNQ